MIHYEDFSNDKAIDISGHNYDGIITQMEIKNDENHGNFISADGEGSIDIPDIDFSKLSALSFNVWLKGYSGGELNFLLQGGTNADSDTNKVRLANDKLFLGKNEYGSEFELNELLLDGNWNMITIVSENINSVSTQSGFKVFINSILIDSNEISKLHFANGFLAKIGYRFCGAMDNFRIYDRAIKQNEINQIFQIEKDDFIDIHYPFQFSDNLISYFTFDDETATDVKTGIDGFEVGGISYSSDTKTSEGFSVSFSNGFIRIESSLLSKINSFSISFWLKSTDSSLQPLFRQGIGNNNNHEVTIIDGQLFCGSFGYGFETNLEDLVFDGAWHMVTVSCQKINQSSDSADMELFIDGIELPKNNFSDVDFEHLELLIIGFDGNENYYNGLMDNIRIYNKRLGMQEVRDIYTEER